MTARRKAKRCGHRHVTEQYIETTRDWLGLIVYEAEIRVCLDCDEQLPFGPARDDGEHAEAVRIEVNAARWAAEHDVTNFADAWRCEAFSDAWLLAAEIATHDDTNGGEP